MENTPNTENRGFTPLESPVPSQTIFGVKTPSFLTGFTLTELMIASAILVTFLGAFLVAFNTILKSANYSQGISLASAACLSKLEEIVSHDFSTIRQTYHGNAFGFNPAGVTGITGRGSISVIDRPELYGGGWTQATASAGWLARQGHTSLVYDNKMWVMGGVAGGGGANDVWYSVDSVTWIQVITNPPMWSARYYHTSLVYDNKMWVMGGVAGGGSRNDIWYSIDGINWNCATASANWPTRNDFTALVYDNKMWVMGGFDGVGSRNDVWYSTNGKDWTQVITNPLMWSARFGHTSLVFDNKMWVMGGFDNSNKNDVWWTNDLNFIDGQTWTQATASAGWLARRDHTALVYDNKMWVMGGVATGGSRNDVWYSVDGVTWTQVTTNPPMWSGRYGHVSLVYDNKMWVMGGIVVPSSVKDVWSSAGYDRVLEVLITVCWKAPDGRVFGEDGSVDGTFDGILQPAEDKDNDGVMDSPAQLRVLLSDKGMAKTFLGRP